MSNREFLALADTAPVWSGDRSMNANAADAALSCTEEAIAQSFASKHEHHLRFCSAWGKWLSFDGAAWRDDSTLATFDLARKVCREAARKAESTKDAKALSMARTIAAVERLARSDRRLAATPEQFDADPWLLNTPTGAVDLRTGEMRPNRPDDFCTKTAAVSPAPAGTECPLWDQFLMRVMQDDRTLINFLQRVAGYALTGITTEHALFFAHGTGRNGKGVFVNTLSKILGDLSVTAGMETFTVQPGSNHPTDLAMLRGARLVASQETEEGRRWAESRIKSLTGGDPITARFMRQDFFTFLPQFKLIIAGNHRPALRGVDEAIRARFNLIPFCVTIPPDERDPDLPEKLWKESPAILRWMIEGCLEWQRIGLSPPAAVRSATDSYLDDEDVFQAWINEKCENKAGPRTNTADLFASWKEWADTAGEFAGSMKRFSQQMQSRGFVQKRDPMTGRAGYADVVLKKW